MKSYPQSRTCENCFVFQNCICNIYLKQNKRIKKYTSEIFEYEQIYPLLGLEDNISCFQRLQ